MEVLRLALKSPAQACILKAGLNVPHHKATCRARQYRKLRNQTKNSPAHQLIRPRRPCRLLRKPGGAVRIARYGVESRERLGRWRWVVERPWVGSTVFADCAYDMSGEQTSTRRSYHLSARSSVGGTSKGFVRCSKALVAPVRPAPAAAVPAPAARALPPRVESCAQLRCLR